MGVNSSWERECALRDEAYRDYLTGLLNRRGLDYAVEALRKEDEPLAVYLFDLDNLKQINDQYGHVEGDQLLVQFSGLLRSHTRATDILARFGGDEFIVVIKQMGTQQIALKKGEDICRAVRESSFAKAIPATASAGVAVWNTEDPLDTILERADEALYRAKRENKGGCLLWRG